MSGQSLRRQIALSLSNAEKNARRLQRYHSLLVIGNILASAGTTLVTALTASRGPVVGEGPSGWKVSCIIAAGLAFLTTVCAALNQQFRLADRLGKANACVGRLRSLRIAAAGDMSDATVAATYQEIVRDYPTVIQAPKSKEFAPRLRVNTNSSPLSNWSQAALNQVRTDRRIVETV